MNQQNDQHCMTDYLMWYGPGSLPGSANQCSPKNRSLIRPLVTRACMAAILQQTVSQIMYFALWGGCAVCANACYHIVLNNHHNGFV